MGKNKFGKMMLNSQYSSKITAVREWKHRNTVGEILQYGTSALE